MLANTNVPNFKYDPITKAIINTNTTDYEKILAHRAQSKEMNRFRHDLIGALKDIEILKKQMKLVIGRTEQTCQSPSQTS